MIGAASAPARGTPENGRTPFPPPPLRVPVVALLVLVSLLFAWTLVSDRMARWSITGPIAFALAGVILTRGADPVVPLNLETHAFERAVELVLAVVLFTDATEARGYEPMGRSIGQGRLLSLALPASVALAVLVGAALFPDRGWWLLAVAALVVMPMDLAPTLMFLRDERVPARVRNALNVEGGYNDGLISPLFTFCVANLVSVKGGSFTELVLNALRGAAYAILAGTVLGVLTAQLARRALDAGWTGRAGLRLATVALPFLAYAASVLAGGNGFVAAFVTGVWYARTVRVIGHDILELVHDESHVLALAVWFTFGKLAADEFSNGVGLRSVGFALLALTVARFLPVIAALIGTEFSPPERQAIGWLGPRGVTSIVFALLAYAQIPEHEGTFVLNVMCTTVLLSVILHGITLEPIARWFQRHPQPQAGPASAGPAR
ncbi:cation:proton antiporter [Kitasatospora sp. NPDC101155]|uniref:cation:proton antiporter domain-containing protein n=1 Tax=Kitasatospora sp. NPDC101155 TaxID=3364097 RepID=UPI003828D2EB